jgi:ribose-phosphate pyrophosphokinase
MARGAKEVYAVVSHGVLAEQAAQKIDDSPITQLLATDTVENHPNSLPEKIQFVSVAPLFGEAIRRIHSRESISAMFPDNDNY